MSQPAKAVWIEIVKEEVSYKMTESQPAKAVWIEIIQREND